MEDSQVVTSFLNALYGREATGWACGWLEVRYLADNEKPVQRWYKPQDIPLDKLRAGNQAGRNIYFGVGLRRTRGGKKGDVLAIPALWVDLDGKDFGHDKSEALSTLDRLRHRAIPFQPDYHAVIGELGMIADPRPIDIRVLQGSVRANHHFNDNRQAILIEVQ
jgi:hypothetical protein